MITTPPSMTSLSTTTSIQTSSTATTPEQLVLESIASTSFSTQVLTQPSTSASVNTSYERVDTINENLSRNRSYSQNQINCFEINGTFGLLNGRIEDIFRLDLPSIYRTELNERLVVIKDLYDISYI